MFKLFFSHEVYLVYMNLMYILTTQNYSFLLSKIVSDLPF